MKHCTASLQRPRKAGKPGGGGRKSAGLRTECGTSQTTAPELLPALPLLTAFFFLLSLPVLFAGEQMEAAGTVRFTPLEQ
jgi:hypothetical protein